MAPTFAFVASLLVLSEAIRSEDDLHEGAMHHSGGVVEESTALICSLGFKFEFHAVQLPRNANRARLLRHAQRSATPKSWASWTMTFGFQSPVSRLLL